MAGKAQLENLLRNELLDVITQALAEHFQTDVLPVGTSEITIPLIDAEQNETFGLIKVSIPRGTRNGEGGYTPYDGYAAAEAYQEDIAIKMEEKREKEKARAKAATKTKEAKQLNKALKNLEEAGLG